MNSHSQQELLNFWKKGKTLNDALCQFTDNKIWQEYKDLYSVSGANSRTLPKDNPEDILKLLTAGLNELSEIGERSRKIGVALDKLKLNFLDKILSEKLIGLGFEYPLKSSDYPAIIPLHLWPEKISLINWDDSTISQNGIQYSKIRIIRKPNITDLPNIQVKDNKTGRPSQISKIKDAYNQLKKNGFIDYSKNFKSHTDLIRETVLRLNPDLNGNLKGLGDEVIRRAVKAQFDADKAARN